MTAESLTLPVSEDHADSPVRIGLLGSMQVADVCMPTAKLVRQAFALLAVNAGRHVPISHLIRELWDDTPPSKAPQSVQSHILFCRRAGVVGTPAEWLKRAIKHRPGSYLLDVRPEEVDAVRFTRLVGQGRARLAEGDLHSAEDTLRAALSLWRGQPLEDVYAGPLLTAWIEGMVDVYRTAQGLMFDIDLRAGRHRELIDPLRQVLREDPTREDTAAKLMTALYRSQRRREALEVYTQTRKALDEYGLDPGPELERLQQQVLQGDRALEWNGEH